MAWGEKYKCEVIDNLGLVWTVKIYEDGYASTVTELKKATGQPLTFNFLGNSDDIYDPIQEIEVQLRVYSSTNFALADLYATGNMHFRMVITTPYGGGDVTRFDGYIDCGDYQEPYEEPPYEVTITAISGLRFLKEIKFDDDGTPYNGRMLVHEIILNILAKIGFTKFIEYINLYEESMADDVDDSPLDQLRIDVDLFRNMYCYDVLAEIIKPFGAVIMQVGDYHKIYRPVELKNATVYGRAFQSPTSKAGVSLTPQRYIDRSTNASYLIQVPGGVKMIIPPASKITIHQDYGNKESWIDNYELRMQTYDSVAGTFENWVAGAGWSKLSIPGETQGVVMQNSSTAPPTSAVKLSQSFGTYIVAASDVLVFSFDYLTANYTGSIISAVTASIMIKSDSTSKYLTVADEEEYEWSNTEAFIELTLDVEVGKSGLTTFSRKLTSIPTAGSYTITLWGFNTASACYILYTNLKFFATNDNISTVTVRKTFLPIPEADSLMKKIVNAIWKKKKWVEEKMYNDLPEVVQYDWVAENAINGSELEFDILIGDVTKTGNGGIAIDNIVEQFSGSLAMTPLHYRVDTVTLTGTSGTANITCNGVTKLATWTSDLSGTAEKFVEDWGMSGGEYYLSGVQVSFSGDDLIFTALVSGFDFTGDTSISNVITNLNGTVVKTTPASDTITFSTNWNSRGGSESKELVSILADEIASQYARPKQLIQMALRDQNPDRPELLTYLMYCYEDDLNKFSGNNRKYIVGRGSFEVKGRYLMIDLKEVI